MDVRKKEEEIEKIMEKIQKQADKFGFKVKLLLAKKSRIIHPILGIMCWM